MEKNGSVCKEPAIFISLWRNSWVNWLLYESFVWVWSQRISRSRYRRFAEHFSFCLYFLMFAFPWEVLWCLTSFLYIIESDDASDGNSVEDVWETNFHFIASKQDEEEKLMSRSQVEVLCCFLYQKIALSLQVYPLKMHYSSCCV